MAKRYEVGGFGDLTGPSRRQAPQRLIFCRAILSALVWDRCLIRTRIMFQLCECLAFVSREVHVDDGQEG